MGSEEQHESWFRCRRPVIAANLNQSTLSNASDTYPCVRSNGPPGESGCFQAKPVSRFNSPPMRLNHCLSPHSLDPV